MVTSVTGVVDRGFSGAFGVVLVSVVGCETLSVDCLSLESLGRLSEGVTLDCLSLGFLGRRSLKSVAGKCICHPLGHRKRVGPCPSFA